MAAAAGAVVAHGFEGAQGLSPKLPETVSGPLAATSQNEHLSSPVLLRYWSRHPDQAPASARAALTLMSRAPGGTPVPSSGPSPAAPGVAFNYRFNGETLGFPQNEEALAKCSSGVVGAVNDYRGFYHSNTGDGTGWEYSGDSGAHLMKEGDLPGVSTFGEYLPSSGDPAVVARNPGNGCAFYAASLAFYDASAVVAYRTTKSTLDGPCSSNCWPVKKVVARYRNAYAQFADKEWIATGPAQGGGSQVVIVYTLFDTDESSIRVVTCDEALTTCSAPVRLDGAQYWTYDYVQFPYVSIGPTGKVYVTWVYWKADVNEFRYSAILRGEVYDNGSWGPIRTIRTDDQPIAQGELILLGLPVRVATQVKSAVSPAGRWWAVWDRCGAPLTAYSECADSNIVARYSDDDGATWTNNIPVDTGPGHQFFPSQPSFSGAANMVIAYYTTKYAQAQDGFDSRYDTEARYTTNANGVAPGFGSVRLTAEPDNPLSDWFILSPFFLGDYLSAVTDSSGAYVHYNADYTKLVPETAECLPPGACQPANQQDNYLSKFTYP